MELLLGKVYEYTLLLTFLIWSASQGLVSIVQKNNVCYGKTGETINATVGASVTVSFCVESDRQVYSYVLIEHPNHGQGWYTTNNNPYESLSVTVFRKTSYTLINITMINVTQADLNKIFSVTIYSENQRSANPKDSTLFIFSLKQSAAPNITLFYVGKKRHREWGPTLIKNSSSSVTVEKKDYLNITCKASGYPLPDVTIRRNDQVLSQGIETTTWTVDVYCNVSGEYECFSQNNVGSALADTRILVSPGARQRSFTINNRVLHNTYLHAARLGEGIELRCSDESCADTVSLIVTNDLYEKVETQEYVNSSSYYVVKEIKNVKCSDMGRYSCRFETRSQPPSEQTAELAVSECPVQLCRSEKPPREVSARLNQTLEFSVCLMSYDELYRSNIQPGKIQVAFLKTGSIYWTVNISVHDFQESDAGTRTVNISNKFGAISYQFTINIEEEDSNYHHGQAHEDEISILFIIIPVVIVLCIVIAVVAVIIYRHTAATLLSSRHQKTSGSSSPDNEHGTYANIGTHLPSSSSDKSKLGQGGQLRVDKSGGDAPASIENAKDDGHYISEEGLVYTTVVKAAKTPANQKGQEAINRSHECVEYTTLDFYKTGKADITKDMQ